MYERLTVQSPLKGASKFPQGPHGPHGPHGQSYADRILLLNYFGANKLFLHKRASIVYRGTMIKDSGFRIRVQRDLREKFVELCRAQDKPAAQVLREFMREYVAGHETANDEPGRHGKKVLKEK